MKPEAEELDKTVPPTDTIETLQHGAQRQSSPLLRTSCRSQMRVRSVQQKSLSALSSNGVFKRKSSNAGVCRCRYLKQTVKSMWVDIDGRPEDV